MASIIIPAANIESLRGEASDFEFGEGAYEGTFETFEIKDLPAARDGSPFAGYATTDGTRLSVRLGNLVPLEGQENPGNRKLFLDIVLSDGEHNLSNVDVAARDVPHWQLQKSARTLANLAMALGATHDVGDGNLAIDEAFLDSFVEGAYTGQKIGFVLYNRTAKSNGKKYPEFERFVQAL